MADGGRRTEAWTRRETLMASADTLASTGTTIAPGPVGRRTRSVLPTIDARPDGEVRLLHEDRERYRSVAVVGEGGMGVVERAEDLDIGRPIAIKRLSPEVSHAVGVARFVGEVRIVGGLDHPNVAPIHDVGVDEEGRYFFVMKYVEGQNLADVIDALAAGDPAAHARWTFERRIEAMIGVLRALEYAHSRGVLHRDVKPDNIMIGRFGEVWLVDWGIAARVGEVEPGVAQGDEAAPALCGTPAYMSPEQAKGAALDARSDVYSAAVTLHEFLCLRHYLHHRADNLATLLDAVIHESPVVAGVGVHRSPHQSAPPIEVQRMIEECLRKDPAARPPSASAVIDALQAYLGGRNQAHCVYSFTKRCLRSGGHMVDRAPRAAVVGMFLAAGLAAFGLVMLVAVVLGGWTG